MNITELLKEKNMTKYRLAKLSGIPYTTIQDICNGRTKIEKCSAETIYKLSKVFNISMESLISDSVEKRPEFELFKSHICHRVKREGDLDFIINVLESGEIRELYEKKWYAESLYLLAMVDYLSRENDLPLCSDYADIRCRKLKNILYPAGIIMQSHFYKGESALRESVEYSIPEFMRHNIVEAEIRNVV